LSSCSIYPSSIMMRTLLNCSCAALLIASATSEVHEDDNAVSLLQTSSAKILGDDKSSPKQDCKDARKALQDAKKALKELRDTKKAVCAAAKEEKAALKKAKEEGRLEKIAKKEAAAIAKASKYDLTQDPKEIPICQTGGKNVFIAGIPERAYNTACGGVYAASFEDCYKFCRGEKIMFHYGDGRENAVAGGPQCAGPVMYSIQQPYEQLSKHGIHFCQCVRPIHSVWKVVQQDRVGGGNWMTCAMDPAPLAWIDPAQRPQVNAP